MASILNIAAYRFVAVADPASVVTGIRTLCEALALKGTVLVAPEGLNIFLAGEPPAIREFLECLGKYLRFADLPVKFSDSDAIPFKRLRVKLKPEIITFRSPGISPRAARAKSLTAAKLRDWMRRGTDDDGRQVVLLDTRNRQEVALGSFDGALKLPIDRFTEFPQALEVYRDSLRGKTVVSFCTGGIRCEKAALWMDQAGYENVLQLDGGILGYFEQVGAESFSGHCFVFDQRVALDPELQALSR